MLESTAERLAADGRVRTLVGFVEAWSAIGDPSEKVRLLQAKAFFDLCLMDRAWVRLKDLVDNPRGGIKAELLASRMFVARGWNERARNAIQRGLRLEPGNDELQQLWQVAIKPAVPPDLGSPSEGAKVPTILAAAERCMVHGSFVRARAMVERVRRVNKNNARMKELSWALEGDFTLKGSLAEVANSCRPELLPLAEISDETEHTEAAPLDMLINEPASNIRFPQLFRTSPVNVAAATTPEVFGPPETGEVTAVVSMANLMQAQQFDTDELTQSGEDTQILRVVHRKGEAELDDVATKDEEVPLFIDPSLDPYDPEEEDDSLVIHRNIGGGASNSPKWTADAIASDAAAEKRAREAGSFDEESWASSVKKPLKVTPAVHQRSSKRAAAPKPNLSGLAHKVPAPTPAPVPAREELPTASGATGWLMLLVLGILLVLAGGLFFVMLLMLAANQ